MTKLKIPSHFSQVLEPAVIGLGLIIIKAYRPDFPITSDQMTAIVVVLVGYILGTAVEDGLAVQRALPPPQGTKPADLLHPLAKLVTGFSFLLPCPSACPLAGTGGHWVGNFTVKEQRKQRILKGRKERRGFLWVSLLEFPQL